MRLLVDILTRGEAEIMGIGGNRLAAHSTLLTHLAQLETGYSKAIKLKSVTEREVRNYSNEVVQIRKSLLPSPPALHHYPVITLTNDESEN